jgi:hypothetical protein
MDPKKSCARLIYGGKNKKVTEAVNRANEILCDSEFYNQIRSYKKFNNTILSSFYIAKILEECSMRINVRFTSLLSSKESQADSAAQITINRWNFNTSLPNRVNLLIQYTVEAVALLNKNIRSEETISSADAPPAAIGNIASVMVK